MIEQDPQDSKHYKFLVTFQDKEMAGFSSQPDIIKTVIIPCENEDRLHDVLLEYIKFVRNEYRSIRFRFSSNIQNYFIANGLHYEDIDSDDENSDKDDKRKNNDEMNVSVLFEYISKQSVAHIHDFIKEFIDDRGSWYWEPTRMESYRKNVNNNRKLINILEGMFKEFTGAPLPVNVIHH